MESCTKHKQKKRIKINENLVRALCKEENKLKPQWNIQENGYLRNSLI